MECAAEIFPVILYTLGSILLIVLIILFINVIKTVKKINHVVDEIDTKQKKLNGIFDFVDSATDSLSIFSDKLVNGFVSLITTLFTKKHKKEDNEDE
jgi:uncharacterized protein YoxC